MDANEEMITKILSEGYANEEVANAMKKVKREYFVPKEYLPYAYHDTPLPIGYGQTISAPSIVALMTTILDVRKGMKVLEIGSGSGYQAAILAEIVGEDGFVFTIERIPELAKICEEKIRKLGYKNVKVIVGDGSLGYEPESPFDRIIITAAIPEIPEVLIKQLKENGKLVAPVGSFYFQNLILLEKNKEIKQTSVLPVMFVPLIGKYGFKI
ncbi:MAG: protein-L-isoaspartate O-methyltransferase [Candidatus Micrarchaeia archaeon]